jgi:hypothetical protein
MAIISDGITDITLEYADERIDPVIERSSTVTAGGNIRSITGGERINFVVKSRVTPAIYRSLLNLITNGALQYFYTPNDTTDWSDLYATTTFPLNVNINTIKREWDNRGIYYITMELESVSYA